MTSTVRDRATGRYREIAPSRPRSIRTVESAYKQAAAIGRRVRGLIAESRDTQEAVAAYLGIGERTLRERLTHPWEFRLSELEDLARRYGIAVGELIG